MVYPLETIRMLCYALLVPMLLWGSFLLYRRSVLVAVFFMVQSVVIMVTLLSVLITSKTSMRNSPWELLYTISIVAQLMAACAVCYYESRMRRKLCKFYRDRSKGE